MRYRILPGDIQPSPLIVWIDNQSFKTTYHATAEPSTNCLWYSWSGQLYTWHKSRQNGYCTRDPSKTLNGKAHHSCNMTTYVILEITWAQTNPVYRGMTSNTHTYVVVHNAPSIEFKQLSVGRVLHNLPRTHKSGQIYMICNLGNVSHAIT